MMDIVDRFMTVFMILVFAVMTGVVVLDMHETEYPQHTDPGWSQFNPTPNTVVETDANICYKFHIVDRYGGVSDLEICRRKGNG